ncbi:MAG: hypothetical protein II886_05475 [Prevotella sp.]|nr:hypothetical protein [Prevotella sp.]
MMEEILPNRHLRKPLGNSEVCLAVLFSLISETLITVGKIDDATIGEAVLLDVLLTV